MSAETFDRAYASNLERALETARIILAGSGVAIQVDPRLREFDFGQWEGLTWEQIVQRSPHLEPGAWADAKSYRPEGGESFAEVQVRAGSFLRDLERDPAPRVLVATHAGVLHAVLAVLAPRLSEEDRALRVVFSPASITRITMEEGHARLITVNDVSHLDSVT